MKNNKEHKDNGSYENKKPRKPGHTTPHTQQTKEKIRASLLGIIPWNKGRKQETPPHNKLPTKFINCKCCGESFEEPINSIRKYAPGHYQKQMSSENNPSKKKEIKEKIRNTLLETYRSNPEILENRKASGRNQYSNTYSSIERKVADCLKQLKLSFGHNVKIGRYFADFVIFDNVIIECDGEYWHRNSGELDRKRDSWLHDHNYWVFRISEKSIKKDPLYAVKNAIGIIKELKRQTESLCPGSLNIPKLNF